MNEYFQGVLALVESKRAIRQQNAQSHQLILNHRQQQSYKNVAQQQLDISAADFQNKQYDIEKKRSIDAGLATAVKEGGYGAGINFLKSADPERAITYHAEKLKLDDQILKSDVLKTVAPVEKQKAMFEAYGLLGKLSAGIEQLPLDQRDKALKAVHPMFKKIVPDFPNSYGENSQIRLKLLMAQGTPENILYDSTKSQLTAEHAISKLGMDIESRLRAGRTPENDPTLRTLMQKRNAEEVKAESSGLQLLETRMQISKTEQQATESFNKTLESSSKDFIKALDSYSQVKSHIESLKDDPDNAYKQSVIQRMFIKSVNSGAMGIADEALGDTATGIPGLNKKLASLISGEKVNLNKSEILALSSAWETTMQGKLNRQLAIEAKYKKSGQSYKLLKKDALRFPSAEYYNIVKQYEKEDSTQVVTIRNPETGETRKVTPEVAKQLMGEK